jgi:hypothetical protein
MAAGALANRLAITNDITVTSVGGPEHTFIVGARSQNANGCGPGAMRCVYMSAGTLQGFTVTGGATDDTAGGLENDCGGGIYSLLSSSASVIDCIISNNIAYSKGGGTSFSTLYRCRISGNSASNFGGAVRGGAVYDSLIVNNSGPNAIAYVNTLSHVTAYNDSPVYTSSADNSILILIGGGNSFVNSASGRQARHSCVSGTLSAANDGGGNLSADPLFVDAANGDFRLAAGSPCVDAANPAYTADPLGVALDGALRTQNGVPDIGAYEWDWRPVFAEDLDCPSLTVTAVTPFVTHTNHASYTGGTAVYLDGAAARSYGQESVELELVWDLRAATAISLSFEVDGAGTLTLYEDDQLIASAVSQDGFQTIKYTVQQKPTCLRAVYAAPAGDTGGALLDAFEGVGGTLILLR